MAKKDDLTDIINNMNKQVKAIENRTMKGLLRATVPVRRSMDKTAPKIPIDTGNLRSSWGITTYKEGGESAVIMGFSANYAAKVHEMVGARFKRPGAGAKFFQAAIHESEDEMLRVIREEAKIKK